MADFLSDSAVEPTGEPGRYRATLSPDWAVWGPHGGYVCAVALQAAFAASPLPRPASFAGHFLAVGRFAPVELEVTRLGGGRRAESLRVEVHQQGRPLLSALVWMVADDMDGYAHDSARRPDVPAPDALRGYQELADDYADWYPIWRHIEGRPVRWDEGPGAPRWHTWLRFLATSVRDRRGDALRQLFWLDFPGWNALIAAHAWPFRYVAPNLDLTVQFHRFAPEVEWMLCDGHAPLATEGLVGSRGRLWAPDGRLLATGTSKHVFRPNPGHAEDLARARAQGLTPAGDD